MGTSFGELRGVGHSIRRAASFHQRYYKTWCLEDLGKAIHLYQRAVKTLLWHVDHSNGREFGSEGGFASF